MKGAKSIHEIFLLPKNIPLDFSHLSLIEDADTAEVKAEMLLSFCRMQGIGEGR